MGKMFFTSWQLWQKMTFVLAAAIAIVFCIAWGKLLWMNRILKKQEVIDEEKRLRIQELRQTGHIVETSKTDVPFGVRAIQSGIQVDGIWISNTTTPLSSELRFVKEETTSPTNSTSDIDSTKSTASAIHKSPSSKPAKLAKPAPKALARLSSYYANKDQASPFLEPIDAADNASGHQSYQPLKASQLRHNEYGVYDEATLGRLEGATSRVHAHQPGYPHHHYSEPEESSAADNEANSATSSDSGNTFSEVKGKKVQYSKPIPTIVKSEYSSVSLNTPSYEFSDPFASPLEGSILSLGSGSQPTQASGWLDDSQASPYTDARSPFIPGTIHQNRNSRRVNSGFEVLPAGTFQPTQDRKGKGVEGGNALDEDAGERRRASRLQKKRKDSIVYEHPPSSDREP